MASFTLRNKLDQSLPISWIDMSGNQQDYLLAPLAKITFEGQALTTQTQRLLRDKYLASGDSQQPVVLTAPTVLEVLPLVMAGTWEVGRYYRKGNVVQYSGGLFMALSNSTATGGSTPDVSSDWFRFSISTPEAFFGVDPSTMSTGEILVKTSSGWESNLVGDANVSALSQGKITGLTTALSGKLDKTGGTMTGLLTLSGAPTASLHAAPKSYVDARLSRSSSVESDRTMVLPLILPPGSPTGNQHAAHKLYVDQTLGTKLSLTGGTLTGHLVLAGSPPTAQHAANRAYVDAEIDTCVALSGSTMTGPLLVTTPTLAAHATRKDYVDGLVSTTASTLVPKAGGTMTGNLAITASASASNHAVTKAYADGIASVLSATVSTKVNKTGDTMTGLLTLSGAPTSNLHASTKAYVDTTVTTNTRLKTGFLFGITALTGGGSGELDGVTTSGMTTGVTVTVLSGGVLHNYMLVDHGSLAGESLPYVVRPDVVDGTRYWRLISRVDVSANRFRLFELFAETVSVNTGIAFTGGGLSATLSAMGLTTSGIRTQLNTSASYVEAESSGLAQTLTNAAAAADVVFTETVDAANDYSSNTFTARYTGRHVFTASVTLAGGSATQFAVYLLLNGAVKEILREGPVGATSEVSPVTTVLYLTAGDTVKIQATQTSGGSRTIANDATRTYFKAAYIS